MLVPYRIRTETYVKGKHMHSNIFLTSEGVLKDLMIFVTKVRHAHCAMAHICI